MIIVCKNIVNLKIQQVNEHRNTNVDNFLGIIFVSNPRDCNFMAQNHQPIHYAGFRSLTCSYPIFSIRWSGQR
ncbi:hypothetical protein DW888_02905 [Bacteroides nordii]|uniref:Uncharacterized protein n=1 Tax=Bacteroides nordii TaxID=291645 RepID=A0A413VVF5_9BACE|nr:hypothetical protein DW888_02905 [Bacteroides nordii]